MSGKSAVLQTYHTDYHANLMGEPAHALRSRGLSCTVVAVHPVKGRGTM